MTRHGIDAESVAQGPRRVLRVGLTGGIACGKTVAARCFASLGVPVIDSDVIARELLAPGCPAARRVAEEFGAEVLASSGELDRKRLRRVVFADPPLRRRLEQIVHPLVSDEIRRRAAEVRGPYLIIVIPLLFETGMTGMVDRALVIDCPEEMQLQRLRTRDREGEEQARRIMAAQVSRQERLVGADEILHNDRDLEYLEQQVATLHARYLELARDLPRDRLP